MKLVDQQKRARAGAPPRPPPRRPSPAQVVEAIRAEAQAEAIGKLLAGPADDGFELTEAEAAWFKRGRNAGARRASPFAARVDARPAQAVSRRGPMRLEKRVYQDASGLECLVGFLYLKDHARCQALLQALAALAEGA